ncbi:MAG: hypothetical protein V3V05_07115 [Pontiella sp.]
MKVLAKILCFSTIVAVITGCATDVAFVPRLPTYAQAKLLDYLEQPDNKVFVVAIDPGGDYAFGYDYGKATLKEAAKTAVEKCDANREANGIIAKSYIYAINNKVVFEEMIFKDAEAKRKKKNAGQEAQIDEAARQDATGEADQPSE